MSDYPKCPYCGREDESAWEWSENEGVCECYSCGESYWYEREIYATYQSRPIVRCQYLHAGQRCLWRPGDEQPKADVRCRPCAYEDWLHDRAVSMISGAHIIEHTKEADE